MRCSGTLEAAVLSDIAGEETYAVCLDAEAPETVRQARLYRQVATAVFFESSGGQVRNEATLPEIRLAVGGPETDIGSVEDALEDLVRRRYYLDAKGTAYWLSHRPTLNKLLADRRATFAGPQAEETVRERVRAAIRDVFKGGPSLDRRYFPGTSADLPDAPALTLVVLAPEDGWEPDRREATRRRAEAMIREYGGRGRTFKSAFLFVAPEGGAALADEVRTLLALETEKKSGHLSTCSTAGGPDRSLRAAGGILSARGLGRRPSAAEMDELLPESTDPFCHRPQPADSRPL